MRLLILLLFATCVSAGRALELQEESTGALNGAAYRIVSPPNWNGTVVLFLHGYADRPATFEPNTAVGPVAEQLLRDGALYAEAGYRAGGWAVAEAIEDVERLRAYLRRRFGPLKRVVLMGESMGGTVALALIEQHPDRYHGGVAFCGGTVAAYDYFKRNAFDVLIAFEALFPGSLPAPNDIPRTFQPSEARLSAVVKALQANAGGAAIVMAMSGAPDIPSLAELLVLHTDALKELAIRSRGNPFDNRRTEYPDLLIEGKPLAQVRRVRSSAAAERYLRRFYTPKGNLSRPFIAVNVTTDPVIPRWATNAYPGANRWFLQRYVEGAGHCSVPAADRVAAVRDVEGWITNGRRPVQ
jgi:pimeloyl-ACP methyl ester carboxylesterase